MAIDVSNVRFYSTREAAELIGRSRDTVLRWIRLGVMQDVSRDNCNNRLWAEDDIKELVRIRNIQTNKKMLRGHEF